MSMFNVGAEGSRSPDKGRVNEPAGVPRNRFDSAPGPESGSTEYRVSPVWQFVLMIIPIVMNGFFVVYTITGWLVSGQYRINWSIEAPGVALYVGAGLAGFSALIMLWLKWRGLPWTHPLGISSLAHGVLAVVLATSIVRITAG